MKKKILLSNLRFFKLYHHYHLNLRVSLKFKKSHKPVLRRNNYYSLIKGAVGAGGVTFDSDGKKFLEYSWGLGSTTNNSAEALAVYMGMRLIFDRSPNRLVVIGTLI
jgi:hypothetical protein